MNARFPGDIQPADAETVDDVAPGRTSKPTADTGAGALVVSFLLCLYMIGTGRWGSYIGIPGAPFFVGDMLFALSLVQVAIHLSRNRSTLRSVARAPLVLLLTVSLAAYATLRMAAGLDTSTTALRDFAPYAYAFIALFAFLLPPRSEAPWRRVIYSVLGFHTTWVVALPLVPGFPWSLPVLGNDAVLLVARPDFDSAICGVSAAFALHHMLAGHGPRRPGRTATLSFFVAANVYGMATLETRAGFLAGLVPMAAVVITWLATKRDGVGGAAPPRLRRQVITVVVIVALASAALLLTPTGGRLMDGLGTSSSQARGTINVRQDVWGRVNDFVLRSPTRTAVGVGFGRNFVDESGSRTALEGTTYLNVRSPHNYIVGTLARLGVAGALLAALIIFLGGILALTQLKRPCGPVTALAAMLCLALPVTALLGVIFESPFGALPYFWAIGQLASQAASRRGEGVAPRRVAA